MPSWRELESNFRDLEPVLKFTRVDGQWGSAGDYWSVVGSNDPYPIKRFEAIARIAGEKLRNSLQETPDPPQDVVGEPDPAICWYKGVARISRSMKTDYPGEHFDKKGDSLGFIYTGRIDRIAEASAIFCLELSGTFPEPVPPTVPIDKQEMKVSKLRVFWDKYGSQILIGIVVTVVGGIILLIIVGK
jgi:hypothetical protein